VLKVTIPFYNTSWNLNICKEEVLFKKPDLWKRNKNALTNKGCVEFLWNYYIELRI